MRLISAVSGVQVPAPPSLSSHSTLNIIERVRRTIDNYALARADSRVLVALSGGPDSVALVHLLLELQQTGNVVVAGLAHFNHQLRGADADADEAFCRAMAASLHLPIDIERADVCRAAEEAGRSRE